MVVAVNSADQDREKEKVRYELKAIAALRGNSSHLDLDGAESIPIEFRTPYSIYESHIAKLAQKGVRLLDICCGDGRHSLSGAKGGCSITVTDIAPANLKLTCRRAARLGISIDAVTANAEELPFPDSHFDIITCAGSMSYVDHTIFLGEVHRVLNPGGAFVFVDSLNHNPVYRLNRFIHYLRGHRSFSTLRRMPTMESLNSIRATFPDLVTSFHGIFSFLAPIVRLAGSERAACWLDSIDRAFPLLHRFAFKVVGVGHKPAKTP